MAKKFEGRIDAIYREIETTKGVIRRLPELEESLKGLAEQRRKQFKETQKMFARLSVELMLGRGGSLAAGESLSQPKTREIEKLRMHS